MGKLPFSGVVISGLLSVLCSKCSNETPKPCRIEESVLAEVTIV